MTVQETIDALQKMPKSMRVLFDCSHCGHGMELVEAKQCVIIETRKPAPQRRRARETEEGRP